VSPLLGLESPLAPQLQPEPVSLLELQSLQGPVSPLELQLLPEPVLQLEL
jgi:hypothetical protein